MSIQRKKIFPRLFLAAALIIFAILFTGSSLKLRLPNFVFILTDDMDSSLMAYMHQTNELIAKQGVVFKNYFVSSSLCCPARASILRGQYAHNTNVLANRAPEGGFKRFFADGKESETLAVWMNRAGYQTGMFGKYLNGYPIPAGREYIPAGWTSWTGFLQKGPEEGNFYYDYSINDNTNIIKHESKPEDYSTDVLKQKALNFINQNAASQTPFFAYIAVYAPHGPSIPADRHAEMFAEVQTPRSPSFNEADISDKPSLIHLFPPLSQEEINYDDALYRKRVRSLQAVDEMVAEIVSALEKNGALDNTYIIFTSDNGFHIGEHRLPASKGSAYEEDIRVPMMIRGPGIRAGSLINEIALNIDIAPTLLDLANSKTSNFVDGRSWVALLKSKPAPRVWRKGFAVELCSFEFEKDPNYKPIELNGRTIAEALAGLDYCTIVGGGYRAIRSEKYLYVEYENGEKEYYDLIADPYELINLITSLDAERLASLHNWLEKLSNCAAETCRSLEESLP